MQEGQEVSVGETVIWMDDTSARASFAAIEKNIIQLRARQARLEAERDGAIDIAVPQSLEDRPQSQATLTAMAGERQLFADRRASRDGQKARLREQISQLREQIGGLGIQKQANLRQAMLIENELAIQRKLFDKGLTSLNRVSTLDRSSARLEGERGELIGSIASTKSKIAEIDLQLLQIDQDLRTEVATELRDVGNRLAALAEDEVTARDRLTHANIKAPIAGVVHLLSVHTVGGVIAPGETLMEIVPKKSVLTVEARISPQDIDQITIGQTATLRLTAFNRNTTPELTGSVIRISADLETDQTTKSNFYRAAIEISEATIRGLPQGLTLRPGMPVETFITTRERTALSYFLKPLRDHANHAFRAD